MSIQGDPVCGGDELIQWALHEEALIPEDGQPMLRYHLGKLCLGRRCLRSEATGVLNLPLGGQGTSLQS